MGYPDFCRFCKHGYSDLAPPEIAEEVAARRDDLVSHGSLNLLKAEDLGRMRGLIMEKAVQCLSVALNLP